MALNVQTTPPRVAANAKIPAFNFDGFEKVLSLLRKFLSMLIKRLSEWYLACVESVSHLLGLLGLVVVKVKLLDITRRLCDRHSGTSHEGQ